VSWLRDRAVSVWAGIGHPEALLDQVAGAGARVVHAPRLRDHQGYDAARIARLLAEARREGAQAIVCTGKDWAKLSGRLPPDAPAVARPELRLEFRSGEQALREAILAAIAAGDARLRR
jgi:tetraacyldisaccharide-1-P 4'-kinase